MKCPQCNQVSTVSSCKSLKFSGWMYCSHCVIEWFNDFIREASYEQEFRYNEGN